MRSVKMIAAVCVAALAFGVSAAVASAKSGGLLLSSGASPAPVGTETVGYFLIGTGGDECVVSQFGRLESNERKKDLINWGERGPEAEPYCFEAKTAITGSILSTQQAGNGTVKLYSNHLQFEAPLGTAGGACYYKVSHALHGTETVPGESDVTITSGTAKLESGEDFGAGASAEGCPRKVPVDGEAQIGNYEHNSQFFELSPM
jgi:hypothetical protein